MCGIVGGVSGRNVTPILLEGLKTLEYRGYDSSGLAVINGSDGLVRIRATGKISVLEEAISRNRPVGQVGLAHTRWATHGEPSLENAHPHVSENKVAIVHNGIIENYVQIKKKLEEHGYQFDSKTDSEVIAHLLHDYLSRGADLFSAAIRVRDQLEGAYAFAAIALDYSNEIVGCRFGAPLVIGQGIGENFIASDVLALLSVTQKFVFLENGDVAKLTRQAIEIVDEDSRPVDRPVKQTPIMANSVDRGSYRHFMQKEIFEQPAAISATLEGRISNCILPTADMLGAQVTDKRWMEIEHLQLVACGTSYHAALVGKYWFEEFAGIHAEAEVASEFRYRKKVVLPNTLFVTLSQSGETADTLAALQATQFNDYLARLTICNVAESSLVRESDWVLLSHAGPEIGVASTKAFTTQLVGLMLLVLTFAQKKNSQLGVLTDIVDELIGLGGMVEEILKIDHQIKEIAADLVDKDHALFLGRGAFYPIALEGSLKLKEISYIHAEAYPAGELKHGPLALVDEHMPVFAIAPNNEMIEKLKANLEEVKARKGMLYVFAEPDVDIQEENKVKVIKLPVASKYLTPLLMTIPLQMLAYHTAVMKGTDVDQPRNLAKSVTVE